MNPLPNRDHQELVGELWLWLRTFWARPNGNRVYLERNVAAPGAWPVDYRGPDVVLLTPDRFPLDKNQYIDGPPTAVIEVRSPEDESYDKLPFYAALGVSEVWIVDRDTKRPEVFTLSDQRQEFDKPAADGNGRLASPVTGAELRVTPGRKLAIRIVKHTDSYRELPED